MAQKSNLPPIAILDYGMGNLSSVYKALLHLGAKAIITHSPTVIARAKKIILPGVGAFGDAMHELERRNLIVPLKAHIENDKKFLGICLGLQLLFEKSEENRRVKGLGILSGPVQKFKTKKAKVPHMGWNQLKNIHTHPVLNGITTKDYFYFVHSFYPIPKPKDKIAECEHGGEIFTAIAGNNNTIAVQFHPEKSQAPGLRLLNNFILW